MIKSLREKSKSLWGSLWDSFWVDYDLRKRQRWARRQDERIFASTDADPDSVRRVLALAEQVGQQEYDRETNLNARGAAVATVAGVIVAVSGAVAKSLFPTNPEEWRDWTKVVTLSLFAAAIFLVAGSMVMAVLGVLRPQRGARTKNYLGETLMGLWVHEHNKLLEADKDRVDLVCLDRALRTVPEWHIRNRSKARWLRRSWMFLLGGVLLIALAAVFLLVHLLGIQEEETGPKEYALWHVLVFLFALTVLAYGAVRFDLLFAGRRAEKWAERPLAEEQTERAADARDDAEKAFKKIFPDASAEDIDKAYKAIKGSNPEASADDIDKAIDKIKQKYSEASAEDIVPLLEIGEITKWLPEPLPGRGRVVVDCRRLYGEFNCSLTIAGDADEVAQIVIEHAVAVHRCADSPELRQRVREILEAEYVSGRDSLFPARRAGGIT